MSNQTDFFVRLQNVRRLAEQFCSQTFCENLVQAYIEDTGFLRADVIKREILAPAQLLALPDWQHPRLGSRTSLGKVAVMVPKNGIGLILAKAIVSSYIMGNQTIVRLPRQLTRTVKIYEDLLGAFLPGTTFAPVGQSGEAFLKASLADPEVAAVVIYGDDAWIDAYWPQAKETGTKLLFEGPGNDALIVMPDADVDEAVDAAIRGGMNNGGQSCSAFERFVVHQDIEADFTAALIARLSTMQVGVPEDPRSAIGPIVSRFVLDRILKQLREAIQAGAVLCHGGDVISNVWRGMPALNPAVLTNCTPDMSVVKDETFGPVFPVLRFESTEDLLRIVDQTQYGLNVAVYGSYPKVLAAYLESHHRNVYYNATPVDADVIATRLVDGGFRRSGFVWEERDGGYQSREGRRYLSDELSSDPVLSQITKNSLASGS